MDKTSGYDLLNPPVIKHNVIKSPLPFGPEYKALKATKKMVTSLFPTTRSHLDACATSVNVHPLATIHSRIEHLIACERLELLDAKYKSSYSDLFPADIPHVSELPQDVLMTIKLCNTQKPIVAHTYSCPHKYHEVWGALIKQHLSAGRIQPSTSEYVSPAFIVLKSDPEVLR